MDRISRLRVIVLGVWVVLALLSSFAPMLWGTPWRELRDGLLPNLGTEMIGAALTYALFELFIGRGERQEEEKARLIMQMGSDVRDAAVPAARELRRHGWLYDGSLQGAGLSGANLSEAYLARANLGGAYMKRADLSGAELWGANLSEALLYSANLSGAKLREANLHGAKLGGTNLEGANLREADLGGVDLSRADLREANLREADLSGANLYRATLSEANLHGANLSGAEVTAEQLARVKSLAGATMPDGTKHE